jgi:hypothetical protein
MGGEGKVMDIVGKEVYYLHSVTVAVFYETFFPGIVDISLIQGNQKDAFSSLFDQMCCSQLPTQMFIDIQGRYALKFCGIAIYSSIGNGVEKKEFSALLIIFPEAVQLFGIHHGRGIGQDAGVGIYAGILDELAQIVVMLPKDEIDRKILCTGSFTDAKKQVVDQTGGIIRKITKKIGTFATLA